MTHNQSAPVYEETRKFLTLVKSVIDRSNASEEESRKRGEKFNMFSSCGVNHYENTHSSIMAELLNPKGNHGQGDLFLKEFLNVVGGKASELDLDTKEAEVIREKDTGNGRMDILIQSSQKAVVIENKIYAVDQWEQLKRYDEYAREHFSKGYAILYLTLDGAEASENSGKDVAYISISYKEDILNWINRCAMLCLRMPLIRETLIQYASLIKQLTNQDMETKYKNELLELMMNNADSVATICNMQGDYIKYVYETRIRPALKKLATEMGFKYGDSDDICGNSTYQGFHFTKLPLAIYFEAGQRQMNGIYYGFGFEGIKKEDCPAVQRIAAFPGKPNNCWPYGWANLDQYRNWDMKTLADMVINTDKFVDYIKGKIQFVLDELERQGIL